MSGGEGSHLRGLMRSGIFSTSRAVRRYRGSPLLKLQLRTHTRNNILFLPCYLEHAKHAR